MSVTLNIGIFSSNNPEDACGFLRVQAPLDASRGCINGTWGVTRQRKFFFRHSVIDYSLIDAVDIILVQRLFPKRGTQAFLQKALSSGKPLIYENDDLLVDIPSDHPYYSKIAAQKPYMTDLMQRATALTVTNAQLKEELQKYNSDICILPNLLDEQLWNKGRPQESGQIIVGFSGTKSHVHDLEIIQKPLAYIAEKYRNKVAFRFSGCTTVELNKLRSLQFLKFTSSYRRYAENLQASAIDIAVAPLKDNRFNRCKSNIKWLEYSACGAAGVYSDLPPYSSCVDHGKTGLLAGADPGDWIEAIEFLIDDTESRRKIAAAARDEVLSSWNLSGGVALFEDFYHSLV